MLGVHFAISQGGLVGGGDSEEQDKKGFVAQEGTGSRAAPRGVFFSQQARAAASASHYQGLQRATRNTSPPPSSLAQP